MRLKSIRDAPLARLLAAMAVGALVGAFAPACVIRALNSFGSTFAQFIKFIVPFIIVGLVTPAIAEAGRSAGRMLLAKIVVFSAGFLLLSGGAIGAGAFAEYILLLSVLAVAAPGVPGGMVLAAAPIAESALGLAPEHYAILMAAYLSIDGVGTACNLTGDGAIALVVDKFRRCNA